MWLYRVLRLALDHLSCKVRTLPHISPPEFGKAKFLSFPISCDKYFSRKKGEIYHIFRSKCRKYNKLFTKTCFVLNIWVHKYIIFNCNHIFHIQKKILLAAESFVGNWTNSFFLNPARFQLP